MPIKNLYFDCRLCVGDILSFAIYQKIGLNKCITEAGVRYSFACV